MKHLKIQPRLILDLESPPETNGTLGFPIRASKSQMLTKVNSNSKFTTYATLDLKSSFQLQIRLRNFTQTRFDILKLMESTEIRSKSRNSK